MTSLCKKNPQFVEMDQEHVWWTQTSQRKKLSIWRYFPFMLFLLFFKVFLRSNLYQCPFPLSSIYFILQWSKILKKDKCLILLLLLISGPASSTRFNISVDFKTDLCFLHLNIHSLCAMVMLNIWAHSNIIV